MLKRDNSRQLECYYTHLEFEIRYLNTEAYFEDQINILMDLRPSAHLLGVTTIRSIKAVGPRMIVKQNA